LYCAQYNLNEWEAWTWGKGLRDFVSSTNIPNGYTVNVAAHSLGNTVVGSAIQLGMAASNIIMLQGAIPAGCFDTTGGKSDPTSINGYPPMWNAEANNPTPDSSSNLGYRGFVGTSGGAKVFNFYNAVDYALATGPLNAWEGNQEINKPDLLRWPGTQPAKGFSEYTYMPALDQSGNEFGPNVGQLDHYKNAIDLGWLRLTSTFYESMSFVARSRSKAAGAVAGIQGIVYTEVDLGPGSPTNLLATRADHSGEFTRDIQQLQSFYEELFNIIEPQ
jgi:hypothetical protein